MDLTVGVVLLGAIRGLLVGLSGVGVVLVFRSTRILNLAQGQLGVLLAAVMGRLIVDHGFPYFVALPLAVAGGVLVGVVIDVGIISRLREAPRVIVVIATLAVAELCAVGVATLPDVRHNQMFPTGIHVDLSRGATTFGGAQVMVLAVVPAVVLALTLFLAITPTGLAIRAAAQNPEAATLAGISPRRVSATVWGMAGGIAVLTGVLTQGIDRTAVAATDAGFAGSTLLLSTLAAALIGGLRSLPRALAGGLAIGVGVQVLGFNRISPDRVNLCLLGLTLALAICIAVFESQRRRGSDPDAAVSLTRGRLPAAIPEALRSRWYARRLGGLGAAGLLAAAAFVPLIAPGSLFLATRVVLFAMLGLSLTILTSWAGQLSLGQVALYAVAAVFAAKLVSLGAPFPVAIAGAVLIGAAAALLIALPALIARGALLAIITLALAIAVPGNLFAVPGFSAVASLSIDRPALVRSPSRYYLLCLVALTVVTIGVAQLRRTGIARRVIAARSNPRRAASLTVDVIEARLTAFALSGAIAGLAGGLFAGLAQQLNSGEFPALDSLIVVAVVAIGGFASSTGPLVGAAFVLGVPAAFGNSTAADYASAGFGLLAVLLYAPGGITGLLDNVRQLLFDLLQRAAVAGTAAVDGAARTSNRGPAPAGVPALVAVDLAVNLGGRQILEAVSLEVARGEVLGLVGSNGAGKSTLLALLAGELTADSGRVWIAGREATGASAEVRASAGVGRIFQDAMLFGDLTTAETIGVALEAGERSQLVTSVLSLPASRRAEMRKQAATAEVMGLLGLRRYAGLPVSRLSTGTRRIVELGCLIAQGADLWLLDEPTAGLAQREVEAFGPLLVRLRADLGATVVLVEHDLPLVSAVSDRLLCLGDGRVLATGTPGEVLADPAVRASYLGQRLTPGPVAPAARRSRGRTVRPPAARQPTSSDRRARSGPAGR